MDINDIKAGDSFVVKGLPRSTEKSIFKNDQKYTATRIDIALNEVWVGDSWVDARFVELAKPNIVDLIVDCHDFWFFEKDKIKNFSKADLIKKVIEYNEWLKKAQKSN